MPEVLHVCLVFGDDQRKAGDFGGEIAQFDAAKVGERDVAFALRFATALVDLVFDMAQFFVGDDEEVAAAAGGVKDADAGDALAQVEQFDFVVAGFFQLGAQCVKEERVEHFEDVGHAGVVHAEFAAFFFVGDRLDHRAEDVRVDFRPVEQADLQQVGAGGAGEAGNDGRVTEEAAVDVGEFFCPSVRAGTIAVFYVHRAEDFADDEVGIAAINCTHLFESVGKGVVAEEYVGAFGEKTEDEARHEVVHIVAAVGACPVGVVLKECGVEAVEFCGGADVKGAVADGLDGADAGEAKEEAEVVGEVGVIAKQRFAALQVGGVDVYAVGGKQVIDPVFGVGGALFQGGKGGSGFARRADEDVNVVALEDAAAVALVGFTRTQSFQRGGLVAKGFEELVGKFVGIPGLAEEFADGLFDFDGVHGRVGLVGSGGL